MPFFSAVMVGDSSLLIPCGEHWLGQHHTIAAVVSSNVQISAWAQSHQIPCYAMGRDLDALLRAPFDFLFSVGNLVRLGPDYLAMPTAGAFNFHDGPLPRYAGLNTPLWALINGERAYGVVWHRMTDRLDAGEIAVRAEFPITADETGFSLNSKCFAAGLSTFSRLTDGLTAGSFSTTPEAAPPTLIAGSARPSCGGLIDPSRSVATTTALVRALDTRIPNPLGRGKVQIGAQVMCVRSCNVTAAPSGTAQSGDVLDVTPTSLTVAVSDGAVTLSDFTDLRGREVSPTALGITRGHAVAAPTDAFRTRVDAMARAAARGEGAWLRRLPSHPILPLAYPRTTDDRLATTSAFHVRPLRRSAAAAANIGGTPSVASLAVESLAALAVWISRLTGGAASIAVSTPATRSAVTGTSQLFEPSRPLLIEAGASETAAAFISRLRSELADASAAAPLSMDFVVRMRDAGRSAFDPPVLFLDQSGSPDARESGIDAALGYDLIVTHSNAGELTLLVHPHRFAAATADAMQYHLETALDNLRQAASSGRMIAHVSLVPDDEADVFARINAATAQPVSQTTVDCMFREAAAAYPDRAAVRFHATTLTYGELAERVTILSTALAARGCGPGSVVAVCLERTPDLIVTLLAVLTTGACYVPIDPQMPPSRVAYILDDTGAKIVLTDARLAARFAVPPDAVIDPALVALGERSELSGISVRPALRDHDGTARAYLIYTSGSTGKPKGVCVTHRNVVNFFVGMRAVVPQTEKSHQPDGSPRERTWLAVTGVSFDIAVLELLWTLTHGFTVALHSDRPALANGANRRANGGNRQANLSLSLFYFGNTTDTGDADGYRLLLEGAKFADANGFEAVWTPERHFEKMGGLFANPAITSSAVAAITTRVGIRAGSCVLPLHDPIRVAEEWSIIDNLSAGRVGLAMASGWMPNDFVLAPQNFADRKTIMFQQIETLRQLWRGKAVTLPNASGKAVAVHTYPRPVQAELPVWLTAAKNPETFEAAGRLGFNVLTHMLGMSLAEVGANIAIYRKAWTEAGHPGHGQVTLMLHTYIGETDDETVEIVRGPLKSYLASAVELVRAAAWSFPTIAAQPSAGGAASASIMEADLSDADQEALLEHAFHRYYSTSGLFGTVDRARKMADSCRAIGVDEIACLLDFGIPTDIVLESLPRLKLVLDAIGGASAVTGPVSVAGDIERYGATHLQCTPSMATMLVADDTGRAALGRLDALLVGGEALPADLAAKLAECTRGALINMYGPTETTVWSTTAAVSTVRGFVDLGLPIANTSLFVVAPSGAACPSLVAGELCIGGEGVTEGYWNRPELTAERFLPADPLGQPGRVYKTGDLVRRHGDGTLEFLGRIDDQVKIRGHRIELGEIETAIAAIPGVMRAVVIAETNQRQPRLVAFVQPTSTTTLTAAHVRDAVTADLPAIMVPSVIRIVPSLPLNSNGKIDRAALRQLLAATTPPAASPPAASPATKAELLRALAVHPDIERRVEAIWQKLLGVESIERTSNFFDIGGHSLMAVQLQRLLSTDFGRDIPLTEVFQHPTIQRLCHYLAEPSGQGASEAVAAGAGRAQGRLAARQRATLVPSSR